ncbi:MAG TPA: keto-deoxy-phosphogluconate aldolase, partial [Gammaproteobacteria bacterium]|nr:keto-deoxy-phosphogluconate aldolase [Gammaproteobacteria bacterium]
MHPVLKEALERSPVMPVLVIPKLSMAKPLAEALASGGLTVFEITLRTACALEAMAVMKQAVPDALIGAGTVTNPERLRDAQAFGADFVVSPGTTES